MKEALGVSMVIFTIALTEWTVKIAHSKRTFNYFPSIDNHEIVLLIQWFFLFACKEIVPVISMAYVARLPRRSLGNRR